MLVRELTASEIGGVSGGLRDHDDWRIVPEWMWAQLYSDLAYPAIPPKYQDSDPTVWVYD
jgi:hypothetical protein